MIKTYGVYVGGILGVNRFEVAEFTKREDAERHKEILKRTWPEVWIAEERIFESLKEAIEIATGTEKEVEE